MLLSPIYLSLLSIPLSAVGQEFLVVDGIIGGVPRTGSPPAEPQPLKVAATTPGALRVVQNSGVCETTPGVQQVSGYGDLTATESILCVTLW
ncbi:hypothetical protein E1B28_012921 [Marasmius oreades]|uniref:Uncharacterized protein n=1 Tax=Marasmius oreades TaxID=181124 RepID=A0A9P7RTA2_9AGAR|nr:uncharacterized protein E1B28_012921 [Marasmius oreades]KAG7088975.1 hypothetical protein E1B28_012921 [Marasmius oreades]